MRRSIAAVAAIAALAFSVAARAEVLHYMANLDGASEAPPHDVPGKGMAMADLDTATRTFTYKVDYSNLTGPAVAAHFHGPAAPGVNAGPVVMIAPAASPLTGTATLTDAQIADLNAGKWYVNVHTAANKGGEIRGQVLPMK
jgi:hypothetical protein